MRKTSPKRLAAIGLVFALATLGSITAAMFRSTTRAAETGASIKRTGDVLATSEAVLLHLQRAVSSQRAFMLTGDDSVLAPFEESVLAMETAVGRLTRLTSDDPDHQRRIETLMPLLEKRIHRLNGGIDRRRSTAPTESHSEPDLVTTGEALQAKIRTIVDEISDEEHRLLAARERAAARSASLVQRIVVAMGVVSAVMLLAAFRALAREIDQRLIAEEVARRDAEEIEDLYNLAPCGYHSLDAAGRFVHINDTELGWLGYSREEVVDRLRFADLLTPEGVAKFERSFPIFLETGFVEDLEFDMVRRDGSLVPVSVSATAIRDEAGRHVASRSTVFDIAARKRIEEERDRIFTLSQDLLCIADASGRLIRINPAWERVLGYAPSELENQPFLDFVHPEDRAATLGVFEAQIDAGTTITAFENRYRARDGRYRVLLWSSTPVAEEGKVYASARDITERKRSEDTLRAAKLEADAANQELESFSYSVSHDLRAPLRAIDGFSTVLLEDYGSVLDAEGQRHLERVRNATRRMSELIDDLLNLSRLSRRQLVRGCIDLGAMAQEVVAQLRRAEPDREVEIQISTGPDAIGDLRLVRIVLENLLGNAWKYTRKAVRAKIEVGRGVVDGEPAWWVRDNGAGFDMAHSDRLFSAFQRLHRADEFEGTGIGLATAKRIIRRHGGRIWAEAAVDEGATFYFTLGPQEMTG